MEVIEKINKYYEHSLREKFSDADLKVFQKLVNDFNIHAKKKNRRNSKHWFYSLSQLSKPYFLTMKKRQEFSKITDVLMNVFEKLAKAYHSNEDLRNILSVNSVKILPITYKYTPPGGVAGKAEPPYLYEE